MAAVAPVNLTLPERPLGPWVEELCRPRPAKPESSYVLSVESSYVLSVPGSSEDSYPAPAAAVSPAWVPPPMPAVPPWAKDPMSNHRGHSLGPNPKAHRQQSMRVAKIALDYYNKKNRIKLELLVVGPVVSVPSSSGSYKHINFTARSRKEGSSEQLFFAELQVCSRRQNPSGLSVICCEPLGSDSTAGRWAGWAGWGMDNPEDTSLQRKDVDVAYCYGCGPNILHPKGAKYDGGHRSKPYVYNNTRI